MELIKLDIRTNKQCEMIDITREIRRAINDKPVKNGLCVVFSPHTTAAITINENADPDVRRDMLMELSKIVPFDDGYHHAEGNSAAHIKTSLFGESTTVILKDGTLQLGTWQGIYFCEFDGPRRRQVWISLIGD